MQLAGLRPPWPGDGMVFSSSRSVTSSATRCDSGWLANVGVSMKITRRINNNAVVCLDSKGRQVIALGKGVGFKDGSDDLPLYKVERTFYDVDERFLPLVDEIPIELLNFSAELVDVAKAELPYELGPNAVLTLADHVSFVLERSRKSLRVKIPFALEVRQSYPLEYKIGQFACRRIEDRFGVSLSADEAAGIALNLMNSAIPSSGGPDASGDLERQQRVFEKVVSLVEGMLSCRIDLDGFNYARFATHLSYLLGRVGEGKTIDSGDAGLYETVCREVPEVVACVDAIVQVIEEEYSCALSPDERLYLVMHVDRVRRDG